MATPTRRSIYADKLGAFSDFAFGDDAVFQNYGQWERFFRQRMGPTFNRKIIFEIGCFDAAYLCAIAAKHPDTAFVGLDWKAKAVFDGGQRAEAMGLRNVALLRGRAQQLSRMFAESELDEIWLFHPDPCDRDVERAARLFNEPFLLDAHRALRHRDAALVLKTDHPGYYQWALGLLGLSEPEWFGRAREILQRDPKAPSSMFSPRVRARDLMQPRDVPSSNSAIRDRFDVAINSADYWGDVNAIKRTANRCFAGEVTIFESRFRKKHLPIYYLELRKR